MNIQDELSVFKSLETQEQDLFSLILWLSTHKKFFLDKFVEICKLNKELKAVSALQKDINTCWNEIKAIDSLRLWFDFSTQLIKNNVEDTDEIKIYFLGLNKDDQYDPWAQKVISSYQEIIKIKNDFAVNNLGLVRSVVNNLKFSKRINIDREDLVQEGYFGLMRAIEKFDHTRGLKFSTYAVWWIRHTCQRHVFDKHILIRTPVHTSSVREKIFEFETIFQKDNSRPPSDEEIQKATGYSKLTLNTIVKPFQVFSLDKTVTIDNGDQVSLHEKLEDDKSIEAFSALEDNQTSKKIKDILRTLSDREQKILFERFGFNDLESKSLQEIGLELKLSREGVRLIQIQALNKVKNLLEDSGIKKI